MLRDAWNVLKGTFFLPEMCLEPVLNYLKTDVKAALPRVLWARFDKFVKYLVDNYFAEKPAYPHALWCYYAEIRDFGDFNTTSNAAEVVNRKLKSECTGGLITFHRACAILQKFKTDYISDKEKKSRTR